MLKKSSSLLCAFTTLSLSTACFSDDVKSGNADPKNPPNQSAKADSTQIEPFTGKIIGNKVRMRTQPDLDGKVVKELSKGDLLIITGENNGYYAIQPPKGTKGYVFRSYILDNVVEGSRVNVRLEPSLDAPVMGQLKGGERVNGVISKANAKWLEIDSPPSARFYVAKEYVQSVGTVAVFETIQKRKHDADELLDRAYAVSQNELRKPFDQIQLEQIYQPFNKLLKDYQDFPEIISKANEGMDLVQKTYLQKQIAFLESKTQQTEDSLKTKQASINSEIEGYQKKLAELEEQLKKEREASGSLAAATEKANAAQSQKASAPSPLELPPVDHVRPSDAPSKPAVTPQMQYWVSIENGLYQKWLRSHPPASIDEFYKNEQLNSTSLKGTIAPFSQSIKNRPGDFILKVNNLPVAYLYSTRVNLQDLVGKQVRVTAVSRPNNNFAYPAYFVLSAE
jgi:uncharacterized protein YgiM (DUF1202 family)